MKPNHDEVQVHSADMGGWVRFFTDRRSHNNPELAVILSTALSDWFRARPHFHLRCVVPIQKEGTTVELHCWFAAHVFPPTTQSPTPIKQ